MRKQDYLVQLIHSLNANEQRFFKLYNSPQKGAKKYELLFDELLKSETYNAGALCKKLKLSKKQLADDKAYLQVVLLRVLRNFNEKARYVDLLNDMVNAHLLIQRKLIPFADDILEKAAKEAMKSSHYELAFKAYSFQVTIGSDPNPAHEARSRSDSLLKNMEECIGHMQLSLEFEKLRIEVFAKKDKKALAIGNEDVESIEKLLHNPLLNAEYDLPHFNFFKHDTLSTIYHIKQDFEKALEHEIKSASIMEAWPEAITADGYGYFMTMMNLVAHYISAGRLKEAEELTVKLKTRYYHPLVENGKELDVLFDAWAFKNMAAAYNRGFVTNTIESRKIKEFVAAFAKEFKTVEKYISGPPMVALLASVARCCFWIKDFDGCIRWSLELQNNYPPDLLSDFQGTAKIWFAMAHAEMKNYKLLDSLLRNTETYFTKFKIADESDKITLRFLKRLAGFRGKSENYAAFSSLLDDYNELKRSKVPVIQAKLDNYIKWAEDKLHTSLPAYRNSR